MSISFDFDIELIPGGKGIAKLPSIEEIRKGTSELISNLKNETRRINIYATSFRAKGEITCNLA